MKADETKHILTMRLKGAPLDIKVDIVNYNTDDILLKTMIDSNSIKF